MVIRPVFGRPCSVSLAGGNHANPGEHADQHDQEGDRKMKSRLRSMRILALCIAVSLTLLPSLVSVKPTLGQQVSPGQIAGSSGPAVVANPTRLPRVAQTPPQVRPRLSQVDPATLDRLKQQHSYPGAPMVRDRASARGPVPGPLTPTLQRGFEGVNQDVNAAIVCPPFECKARPPDPDIAAGPNHIIQVENVVLRISTKDGATVSTTSLATWFSSVSAGCGMGGCSPFDPRVAYDPLQGRWILIALHLSDGPPPVSRMLVSVSQTSDPTGTWNFYNLDGSLVYPSTMENTWSDYPDVGFDLILSTAPTSGAIYLTTNNFTFPTATPSFRTSLVWILSKNELYTGAALTYWRAFDRLNANTTQAFTYRAAKMYGANPGVEFLVNSAAGGDNFLTVWNVTPTYPPTAISMNLQVTITIGAYGVPANAAQSGCGNLLDTLDNRLINAVWRNNQLYTMFTESNSTVSNIRYNRINTSTNMLGVSTSIGDGTNFYFIPSVAVENSANAGIAFSRSGSGEFANARYTGVNNSDVVQTSTLLQAGVECITGTRWGDYSGAAVDPVGFRRIWLNNEWAANSACGSCTAIWDWSTWVARVQFGVVTTVGLYNPATSIFFLRNSNSTGVADVAFVYGPAGAGWIPIAGNWTGQGIKTVGLYNPATSVFYLRNSNSTGVADITFTFGPAGAGWIPVVGDWNGDGVDTVGLYNPATSVFYLRNSNSTGVADITFTFGPAGAGWTPIAGDWDGDGVGTVGLYNPVTSTFFLRNFNTTGVADMTFVYGPAAAGWIPRAGDWDSSNTTTVGLYNPMTSTFFLRNSNTTGVADMTFVYGPAGAGWTSLSGDWDGF